MTPAQVDDQLRLIVAELERMERLCIETIAHLRSAKASDSLSDAQLFLLDAISDAKAAQHYEAAVPPENPDAELRIRDAIEERHAGEEDE